MASRKKDVVLMAMVSSFEGLAHPTRSELRQFAELFTPLFQASSEEARRQAVAALSQCAVIPQAVALFIGNLPISVAAPFLTVSQAISDDTLIMIARTQGTAHIRAIVCRDNLSPKVIDALVALRQATARPSPADLPLPAAEAEAEEAQAPAPVFAPVATEPPAVDPDFAERLANEEAMRQKIRGLANHLGRDDGDRLGLRTISDIQEALLVRFARSREASHFASTLTDALSASRWLAERIMLDLSGQQLATTLVSLGMGFLDSVFVLEKLYPHLSEAQHSVTRAWMVLDALDPEECHERVEAWRRADSYTYKPEERQDPLAPAASGTSSRTARRIPPARELKTVGRR